MGSTLDFSIIIPSCKRLDFLIHGLKSIRNQKIDFNYEIIVLNDGIPDKTDEICREFGARYIFTGQRNLDNYKWRCPGFAINIGIKNSLADRLILITPEIYYNSLNIINDLVYNLGLNSRGLIIPKGYDDYTGEFLKHVNSGGSLNTFAFKHQLKNLHTDYPFCMALNKKEILDIGGYDEDFTGYCYDDTDFVLRLVKNGCYYVRLYNLEIVHLYHTRARDGLVNQREAYLYNQRLYNERSNIIKRNVGREWGKL